MPGNSGCTWRSARNICCCETTGVPTIRILGRAASAAIRASAGTRRSTSSSASFAPYPRQVWLDGIGAGSGRRPWPERLHAVAALLGTLSVRHDARATGMWMMDPAGAQSRQLGRLLLGREARLGVPQRAGRAVSGRGLDDVLEHAEMVIFSGNDPEATGFGMSGSVVIEMPRWFERDRDQDYRALARPRQRAESFGRRIEDSRSGKRTRTTVRAPRAADPRGGAFLPQGGDREMVADCEGREHQLGKGLDRGRR